MTKDREAQKRRIDKSSSEKNREKELKNEKNHIMIDLKNKSFNQKLGTN